MFELYRRMALEPKGKRSESSLGGFRGAPDSVYSATLVTASEPAAVNDRREPRTRLGREPPQRQLVEQGSWTHLGFKRISEGLHVASVRLPFGQQVPPKPFAEASLLELTASELETASQELEEAVLEPIVMEGASPPLPSRSHSLFLAHNSSRSLSKAAATMLASIGS